MKNLVNQLLPPANDAAQGISVPAQVLAGAVDHQV
jgi:hypothetical protein